MSSMYRAGAPGGLLSCQKRSGCRMIALLTVCSGLSSRRYSLSPMPER
jgi:hypothetical protein